MSFAQTRVLSETTSAQPRRRLHRPPCYRQYGLLTQMLLTLIRLYKPQLLTFVILGEHASLSLRLVASSVTTMLILALLLFMVHRLRQRRILIMLRRKYFGILAHFFQPRCHEEVSYACTQLSLLMVSILKYEVGHNINQEEIK